jgi:magnesium-protoporphyrin IX monomethyl ester (oxidative) cyclase
VLPTKLPLLRFYEELVKTQAVINRKFMGPRTAASVLGILARQLARGQTNFLRMLWRFNSVYDVRRQYGEHFRPVSYEIPLPAPHTPDPSDKTALYVHRRPAAAAAPPT